MVPLKEGGKSRYQLLDELGVNFHSDFVRFTFEERLEECREFRRKHDHLSVPLPKKYVKGQEVLESVAERSFIVVCFNP